MSMRTRYIAVGVAVILGGLAGISPVARAADKSAVPLSTPPGITFQDVLGNDSRLLWRYFATTAGKALYTFDADGTKGKRTCLDQCAQQFAPYLAPPGAKGGGEWSLIPAGKDQKQWVFKGHPLYVFSDKDPAPNTFRYYADRDKPAVLDPAMLDPASKFFSPKEGWRRAAFMPEQMVLVPSGIQLKSISVANGYGFVDKSTGMPLYLLKTPPKNPPAWTVMYAPDLAGPVGDFSIVLGKDGKRQWAYKGRGLYSFNGDYSTDDLNGLTEQSDARPALVYTNFIPGAVHIEFVPMRGPLLVTSEGLTLYAQSRGARGGGRMVRGSNRITYGEARAVGTRGCVEDCLKRWKPLLAGANDVASGFWEIQDRPDGAKQWAYKGGPLYTFVDDKHLGDVEGNGRDVIVYGDPQGKNFDLVSLAGGNRGPDFRPYAGAGLHWHVISFYD